VSQHRHAISIILQVAMSYLRILEWRLEHVNEQVIVANALLFSPT
jgi:hypothetical protein